MKLYSYWRSTSSYRVRIALALKGIEVENIPVHLVRAGGDQNSETYRAINPQGRVPSLELDDGKIVTQSPAIIEYLDEVFPNPPLLPRDPLTRAKVRSVAAIICCDVQPLHNVGALNYLRELGQSEDVVSGWITHWIKQGLDTVEVIIGDDGYCFGPEPSIADIYLLPQIYAARRFKVPLESHSRIRRVEAIAAGHVAFEKAHPDSQPDADRVG